MMGNEERTGGKREENGCITEPEGLKSGTESSGSSLCIDIGSNLQLAIDIHPEKLGNKEKGDAYRIEFLRIHTGLLKFF